MIVNIRTNLPSGWQRSAIVDDEFEMRKRIIDLSAIAGFKTDSTVRKLDLPNASILAVRPVACRQVDGNKHCPGSAVSLLEVSAATSEFVRPP